jgi:hypothetical protein
VLRKPRPLGRGAGVKHSRRSDVVNKAYSVNDERTTASSGFPEWSEIEVEMQHEAREAISAIPMFPDLEKWLVSVFGPTAEAIMLHQLVYWFRKPKMVDRWTAYKTREEWKEERGLNRKQVDKGRARLKSYRVLEERIGPYRRVHYRIDWVQLADRLGMWDDFEWIIGPPSRGV